jgi:GNAT superfamily N-acetyltransferase
VNVEIRDDDLEAFFAVPFRVYPPDAPFVSPPERDVRRLLDPVRNPLFGPSGRGARRVLTVHRGDAPVGRLVALFHGTANRRSGRRLAQFGFFDCADDLEAAEALFAEAEAFARARDCERLTGNFNLTGTQPLGVLTDGFEHAPYRGMVWNPPHVPRLLEALGFTPTFPMRTFELSPRDADLTSLDTPAARERLADRALRWTRVRLRDPGDESLEELRLVLNDGLGATPPFVPLAPDEMRFQAAPVAAAADPAITVLVHDADGPIGAAIALPDDAAVLRATRSRPHWTVPLRRLWQRVAGRRAVLVTYTVARRARGRGLSAAMLRRLLEALRRGRYTRLGVRWIPDHDVGTLDQLHRLGARPLHRGCLYEKGLR